MPKHDPAEDDVEGLVIELVDAEEREVSREARRHQLGAGRWLAHCAHEL